ncbi:hypothetical protein [Kitasatospora sp. NPDC050463]|uniref:hypothetical protein n=1 Tax=Kitasatospora sp. NPDC050463 TaxID=3155786 RepID=UPI0033D305BC
MPPRPPPPPRAAGTSRTREEKARRPGHQAAAAEQAALRYGRGHLLDLGRVHTAFVADARARGEGCGPLPAPEHPAGPAGDMYRPAAELAYTATTTGGRRRLRAFIERHRPGAGDEQTAAQLAACARVWEQAGDDGSGRAWERHWRAFPRLLVVLAGTPAAAIDAAVADLRLAAEENPAVADLLTAVPDLRLHHPDPGGSGRLADADLPELPSQAKAMLASRSAAYRTRQSYSRAVVSRSSRTSPRTRHSLKVSAVWRSRAVARVAGVRPGRRRRGGGAGGRASGPARPSRGCGGRGRRGRGHRG